MRRASSVARSAMKVMAAATVTVAGAVLCAAASGPGMAGAECRRGCPRGVGLALPWWRRAWASAWVRLRVAVAASRRVRVAAWRRPWVSAWLRARPSSPRGPWRRRGCSRWGPVLGASFGGFPCGLADGVLDEDVVVVADEVVVVVKVVESEAEERAVGDGAGPCAAGASIGC